MMTLANTLIAFRDSAHSAVSRWRLDGEQYRGGAYLLALYRTDRPSAPELALFDAFTVEATEAGAIIAISLSPEQIADAQGPASAMVDTLVYRLRHDGAELVAGHLWIFPPTHMISPRKDSRRHKGVPA